MEGKSKEREGKKGKIKTRVETSRKSKNLVSAGSNRDLIIRPIAAIARHRFDGSQSIHNTREQPK